MHGGLSCIKRVFSPGLNADISFANNHRRITLILSLVCVPAFTHSVIDGVLVLAGIELSLFLVAGTVLGFGFSVRILLITC